MCWCTASIRAPFCRSCRPLAQSLKADDAKPIRPPVAAPTPSLDAVGEADAKLFALTLALDAAPADVRLIEAAALIKLARERLLSYLDDAA